MITYREIHSLNDRPLIIIGGGGHASILVDILLSQKRKILAIICPDNISERRVFSGIPHYINDDDVQRFSPEEVMLVNGIGMTPYSSVRKKINQYYLSQNYQFETIISNNAVISDYAEIRQGAQIFAGAIIQTGATISEHSIINTGAVIDHDSYIGMYNHIAPHATLCGNVNTEDDVYIGAGSCIVQNVKLAYGSIIAAGTTVLKNTSKLTLTINKMNQIIKLVKND